MPVVSSIGCTILNSRFKKDTCGMCGNFNGDPNDDFKGKFGIVHTSAIEFAKSWQHGRQSACQVGVTQQEVCVADI